jgi:hypothetical protein
MKYVLKNKDTDQNKVGYYKYQATLLMKSLKEGMAFNQIDQNEVARQLPDGTVIMCSSVYGRDTATIDAPSFVKGEEEPKYAENIPVMVWEDEPPDVMGSSNDQLIIPTTDPVTFEAPSEYDISVQNAYNSFAVFTVVGGEWHNEDAEWRKDGFVLKDIGDLQATIEIEDDVIEGFYTIRVFDGYTEIYKEIYVCNNTPCFIVSKAEGYYKLSEYLVEPVPKVYSSSSIAKSEEIGALETVTFTYTVNEEDIVYDGYGGYTNYVTIEGYYTGYFTVVGAYLLGYYNHYSEAYWGPVSKTGSSTNSDTLEIGYAYGSANSTSEYVVLIGSPYSGSGSYDRTINDYRAYVVANDTLIIIPIVGSCFLTQSFGANPISGELILESSSFTGTVPCIAGLFFNSADTYAYKLFTLLEPYTGLDMYPTVVYAGLALWNAQVDVYAVERGVAYSGILPRENYSMDEGPSLSYCAVNNYSEVMGG